MDIATAAATSSSSPTPLDLHISIYVTCLCNPEAVPAIPNSDVTIKRPSVYQVLDELTSFSRITSTTSSLRASDAKNDASSDFDIEGSAECANSEGVCQKLSEIREGGGVAVCASGPGSLTRETANAVARLQMSGRGMRLGGIALHTEVFTL